MEKIRINFKSEGKAKDFRNRLMQNRPALGVNYAGYATFNNHPCVFVTGTGLDEAAIRALK